MAVILCSKPRNAAKYLLKGRDLYYNKTMDIVQKILNDKEVTDKYDAIDKINPYPFNHGMKHIHNVVRLAKMASKELGLSSREQTMLLVAEVLHDLGQVESREGHGDRSSAFAREYLKKYNYFTEPELDIICAAIKTHDEKDFSKISGRLPWLVAFIDKLDFAHDRLEDNVRDTFGYTVYEDIKDVKIKIMHETRGGGYLCLLVNLIDKPKLMNKNPESLFTLSHNFVKKVTITSINFAKHWGEGLGFKFFVNDVELDYTKFIQEQ